MKNTVSKLVISMLITWFVTPNIVSAKIKNRNRAVGTGDAVIKKVKT